MKIAFERIFTSKLRQNAVRAYFFNIGPHITFRDGHSVPPPLSQFVYGLVNDSAIGIWLITLELFLAYLDKISL